MSFLVAQFLTGLASAASLFLVSSGLSLIFGVTRVVNFAHGAFYMLGAYVAVSVAGTSGVGGGLGLGFWAALPLAALATAIVGVAVEMLLLRRLYDAPPLLQLLATFGVTLMVEDLVQLIWGPADRVGSRAPGLSGSFRVLGQPLPAYDLLLIGLGPAVLALLWLLLTRTRWGVLVRAATLDREMAAALGVNQARLFTAVFFVGVFLAGLGGALQLPRDAVTSGMDLDVIVEAFVVVVIGGLGSLPGAFIASVLVAELNAFGILVLPGVSLVLVFLVMALVLALRPHGLLGRPEPVLRQRSAASALVWRPLGPLGRTGAAVLLLAAAAFPLLGGSYGIAVGSEILIFVIFAASLQFLMSVAGQASFGHAAYFGLGAYGAALGTTILHLPMPLAIGLGVAAALAGGAAFGALCVRLSGIYFAMLTLAFAQILWSVAFQWTGLTGGDNGILGVWPADWAADPAAFYWMVLGCAAAGLFLLRMLAFSPFGYALRATRDSPLRAAAIGIRMRAVQWAAFAISAAFAGLGGALLAFLKGSVFPDALGISRSVDGLVAVLLGGIGTVSGAVPGAVLYKAGSIWLASHTDHSRLVLGAAMVALVLLAPRGIGALWERFARPAGAG